VQDKLPRSERPDGEEEERIGIRVEHDGRRRRDAQKDISTNSIIFTGGARSFEWKSRDPSALIQLQVRMLLRIE
jgi:hypothetical protein